MEKSVKVQLEENGYAVVRGLLNPATDLEPLKESTIDSGCMFVVPGSHRMKQSNSPPLEEITNMGIPIEAAPGDVVFFGNNTLHCSLENTSNKYRGPSTPVIA